MSQSVVQVDAFTDTPFRGNPAAVCLLASARDERWMLLVAREMNLSETAFLAVTSAATLRRDIAWLKRHIPEQARCAAIDVSSGEALATYSISFDPTCLQR